LAFNRVCANWQTVRFRPGKIHTTGDCGTFEIDPSKGEFRTLRVGKLPDSGGIDPYTGISHGIKV
jgi:hypothetical protein